MSAEGWILLVGLRVLDLGLLAAWLVWFFRLRDDDDGDDGGPGGGPGPEPSDDSGPSGPGLMVPHGGRRIRDHGGSPGWRRPRVPARPAPGPLPARVRTPRPPTPVHR